MLCWCIYLIVLILRSVVRWNVWCAVYFLSSKYEIKWYHIKEVPAKVSDKFKIMTWIDPYSFNHARRSIASPISFEAMYEREWLKVSLAIFTEWDNSSTYWGHRQHGVSECNCHEQEYVQVANGGPRPSIVLHLCQKCQESPIRNFDFTGLQRWESHTYCGNRGDRQGESITSEAVLPSPTFIVTTRCSSGFVRRSI